MRQLREQSLRGIQNWEHVEKEYMAKRLIEEKAAKETGKPGPGGKKLR